MNDESGESMETMDEVPLEGSGESELRVTAENYFTTPTGDAGCRSSERQDDRMTRMTLS